MDAQEIDTEFNGIQKNFLLNYQDFSSSFPFQ